ncbi:MAG: hypothetical protein F6J87_07890 [Spirulina sp. SIO3F2]|nr:hypothetical protein [Spirulina sp. SIO3F2]
MSDEHNFPTPAWKHSPFNRFKPFTLPASIVQLWIWGLLGFGSFGWISSSDLSWELHLGGLMLLLTSGYWLVRRSQQRTATTNTKQSPLRHRA